MHHLATCVIRSRHHRHLLEGPEKADKLVREIAQAGGRAATLRLDLAEDSFDDFRAKVAGVLLHNFNRENLDFVVQDAGNGLLG